MGVRLPSFLPRVALVVLLALGTGAGLTYAAGQQIAATPPAATTTTPQKPLTLIVPDLRDQAFVFAKGQLQDGGFAWRVAGPVQGYASNTVVSQSPAPGTKLVDTGAPLVTVTLARNGSYPQSGDPEDTSSYAGTPLRLADAAVAAAPALPKVSKPAAAPTTTAATTTTAAQPQAAPKPAAAAPATRPPAFVVPGARKEPLDEIPLPARAAALGTWLAAHPKKTNANVQHWLYQNAWVVAGARMGWWHGADALRTLIAVDAHTESVWGIGTKSRTLAQQALAEVEARSR